MENIDTALLLMVVGMTTVFVILLIVINMSKALIFLVNKYAPEEIIVKKHTASKPKAQKTSAPLSDLASINPQTTAAIVSAISIVTGGKGKVIKIEKTEK